jgi:hypothetical protein
MKGEEPMTERDMQHSDWMNERVRQEIEDLRRTRELEEDEAVAFWHLR